MCDALTVQKDKSLELRIDQRRAYGRTALNHLQSLSHEFEDIFHVMKRGIVVNVLINGYTVIHRVL